MASVIPGVKKGDFCYKIFNDRSSPCERCPVKSTDAASFNLFSKTLNLFLSSSHAKIDLPDFGTINLVTCRQVLNSEKSLMERMAFLPACDYFLEINLSQNKYRYLHREENISSVEYNVESFESLVNRLEKTSINPNDVQKFRNFWDLKLLPRKMAETTIPLVNTYREKNAVGSWDEVTVTLVPEEYVGSKDQIILALYHIKNTTQDVRKLNASEEIDSFTGLYTRRGFVAHAEEYVNERAQSDLCVIAMDVEHFRLFNKWYGRPEGDKLIKRISVFLLEMDRMFDTVSGYAGADNFFIILDNQPVVIDYLMRGISEILAKFDGIEGFRMAFGACCIVGEKYDIRDAMDSAITAVERILGNYQEQICWFQKDMLSDIEHELQIAPEVERALLEHEFTFYLQPKYSVSDKKIVGSEALVRWLHKKRGLIPPAEFIPIIEKNGLVTRVDMYIWELVCETIKKWMDESLDIAPVSVNVSRIDIDSVDVPEIFENLVQKYQIDRKYLEIEITESAFVEDTRGLKNVVQKLRAAGFKVLIDDFGSGYSSLNMLKDLQADVLKMDIKFFDLNNTNYEKGVDIIESVLNMSHKMKLSVIAEGVETEDQINVIKNIGLNYVQGFYYYKPMSVIEYEKMMRGE
ncbi:MAG: GGDEF domain-containing phosphodiesterase [Treponema sp.]|nr:GGDEF domain-containing phosphodiesterase [Treponema sp.]